MKKVNGNIESKYLDVKKAKEFEGQEIIQKGVVHKIRIMSGFAFIILRTPRNLIQCVYEEGKCNFDLSKLQEECAVIVKGIVSLDERVELGFEIKLTDIEIKSNPKETMPIIINKKNMDIAIDTNLNYRPLSLRNPNQKAIFKIQEGLARGFEEYAIKEGFTQIKTPKIVFAGAEGGANIFKLDYFGKEVFLTQSPQFYKQMMVGAFERVFEIGPVYRAEKHNTSRHINEYISMDLEIGFIDSFYDIMNVETALLKYTFELLNREYKEELKLLKVELPEIKEIPSIKFSEAKKLIETEFNRKITDYNDLDPTEEQLLCKYAKEKFDSHFIFITHYPSKKRPFYAMDDSEDIGYTLSFDLLFNGVEITTGGQRIHDYDEQVKKMLDRKMNPDDFESYLMAHKHGLPPHGGLGLGLERLTMNLLGLSNIRETSLFPRDMTRVTP